MSHADRIARFPDPRHARAAAKVRRCKDRKRAGLAVLKIEVALDALIDQLIVDKFLGEWDSENRTEIEHAAGRMVAVYCLGANRLPGPTDR
jgi:hypothetical protein